MIPATNPMVPISTAPVISTSLLGVANSFITHLKQPDSSSQAFVKLELLLFTCSGCYVFKSTIKVSNAWSLTSDLFRRNEI